MKTQLAISLSQVEQFFESPVWQEIVRRLGSRLQQLDGEIEYAEPYAHGKAVGARAEIRAFVGYHDRFVEELNKK